MVNNLSRRRVKQLWVILLIIGLGGILLVSYMNNSTSGFSQSARAALGGGQVTLTVDASKQVGTFSDDMLGVGYANWEHSWGRPFLGSSIMQNLTNAMKEVRPGIIRYAGGNWTNSVGWTREAQRRPYTEYTVRNNKYYFHYGTDEIDALAKYADDIGAEVMIEVNVTENDPQMWADMVRYTNIEKGYGFKYWEIGNENEATWNEYLSPTEYMTRYKAYRDAMKAVDPSIIVIGGGFSGAVEYSIGQANNLVREMGEIAKVGDGITWHWYMEHTNNTIGNIMRYTNPEAGSDWSNKYNSSRQWPDYIVPRINTEFLAGRNNILHGVTELNTSSENRNFFQQNHIAALMVSDALPRLAKNGVDFANFWLGYSAKGNAFSMIEHTGDNPDNLQLNSPWYVYYMFQKYFGEQMVETQTTDKEKMSVWAAKDPAQPGKLMVWVTNFTPNSINADVALQNYVAGSAEVYELLPDSTLPGLTGNGDIAVYSNLNGKKIDAYNVAGSIAQIQPKTQTIEAGGLNRTFPAYSITAFVLTGQGGPVATLTPTPSLAPGQPTFTPTPTPTQGPQPTVAPTNTPVPNAAFTTSATVNPSPVTRGQSFTVTASVLSNTSRSVLVDVEIYRKDDSQTKYYQQVYDNQALTAGQTKTYTMNVTLPATVPTGEYVVKIGIFNTGWGGLLDWNNEAAAFNVQLASGQPTSTPGPTSPPTGIPTSGPTATAVPTATRTPTPTIVVPSATRTPTPVPTTVPSSTSAPTATIAVNSPTAGPSPTRIPNLTANPSASPFPTISRRWVPQSGTPAACPRKPEGDANCDGFVNLIDHEIFRAEYLGEFIGEGILQADFNGDGKVSLVDVQIWTQTFLNQ